MKWKKNKSNQVNFFNQQYDVIWLYLNKYTKFFIICLHMNCSWRSSYQEGRALILLTCLTLSHCCACPKKGCWLLMPYVRVFFMFRDLRWEVINSDCLFCWYWWNCWPSLFIFFFISKNITYIFVHLYLKGLSLMDQFSQSHTILDFSLF